MLGIIHLDAIADGAAMAIRGLAAEPQSHCHRQISLALPEHGSMATIFADRQHVRIVAKTFFLYAITAEVHGSTNWAIHGINIVVSITHTSTIHLA
jgi:hypothetical protein